MKYALGKRWLVGPTKRGENSRISETAFFFLSIINMSAPNTSVVNEMIPRLVFQGLTGFSRKD